MGRELGLAQLSLRHQPYHTRIANFQQLMHLNSISYYVCYKLIRGKDCIRIGLVEVSTSSTKREQRKRRFTTVGQVGLVPVKTF